VFSELGLRRPDSTAIDVAKLAASVTGSARAARTTRLVLGTAVGGVISAAVALTDPAVVIIGGTWGTNPLVLEAVRAARERLARPVAIRPALVTGDAPLAGARTHAVHELQSAITQYRTTLQR
jgi:predicted NBD/HSP70 family sugar kinase